MSKGMLFYTAELNFGCSVLAFIKLIGLQDSRN